MEYDLIKYYHEENINKIINKKAREDWRIHTITVTSTNQYSVSGFCGTILYKRKSKKEDEWD